ncbi:MAG: DUF4920 domain-containing protein [Gemmatimonadaceae bacterium]|nr:DUF4920 domain-containing protein [Gemmatimonadaceae bacterium]
MTLLRTAALAVAIAALTTTAQGQGKAYGKPLTLKEKTPISQILADPHAYSGKRVQVEGTIVEVCEERGCWINIASDKPFEKIRFKVEDGVIVFPLDAKGKKAIAEGVLTVTHLTKEQALAQAKEMHKERGTMAKFDSTKYLKGVTDIQIKGEGARVLE